MKLKALAVAVAIASAATTAQAGWEYSEPFVGNGEMLLLAWDEVNNVSVVQDLGLRFNDFDLTDPLEAQSFALDSAFASTFTNTTGPNVRYSLIAYNAGFPGHTPNNGFLVTSNAATNILDFDYDQILNFGNSILNINVNLGDTDYSTNNALVGDAATPQNYAGDDAFYGRKIGTKMPFDVTASVDDPIYMWAIYDNGLGVEAPVQSAGQWQIDMLAGSLSYSAAAPIPVPAAVWLFASGLFGLGAVARRKKS